MLYLQRGTGSLVVRNAVRDDAASIEQLYAQLSPRSGGLDVEPARADEIAADPRALLLVIEQDGRVVGTALLNICLDAMYSQQPFGVLENVVVNAGDRSAGCGRALLQAVDDVALKADCSKVLLLSGAERSDAHAYFAAMGYDGDAKRGFVRYRSIMGLEMNGRDGD